MIKDLGSFRRPKSIKHLRLRVDKLNRALMHIDGRFKKNDLYAMSMHSRIEIKRSKDWITEEIQRCFIEIGRREEEILIGRKV